MRQLLSTLVAVLAVAGSVATAGRSATAGAVSPPWSGGYAVVAPLEARIAAIASQLSGRRATAYCNSPAQWPRVARAHGLEPDSVYAFVPTGANGGPADYIHLSPYLCRLDDRFLRAPARLGSKRCRSGSRAESRSSRYRATVRKRVRVRGRWEWRRVTVWRVGDVVYRVPTYAECGGYQRLLETIEAIGHESMHVAGIRSEAVAECLGFQLLAVVGRRLGASPRFAYELGADYQLPYLTEHDLLPDYWSPDCHDAGRLDLWLGLPGWPTPAGVLAAPRIDLRRFLGAA